MRIRHKPWARPELAACKFFIDEPVEFKGKWNDSYPKKQPLHVELGCGKGGFISQIAPDNLDINYLAIDIKSEMLGLAKRKVEASYAKAGIEPNNVLLTACNIEQIDTILSENDKVDRIYINFCNPWPRSKQHKKRLVHPRQLDSYKIFLKEGGEIRFKTDDDGLFNDALEYFTDHGYEIIYKTFDLHAETELPVVNYVTEHEKMFSDEGIKIKYLTAKLVDTKRSESVRRLRT
ncbi:MAG: tRNA (guanosine(46)-N7)-methyltransferase TrmB [Oscillospiraceae bacterium]|nr:tRNA (guanosine(46)-N7)-methyltransferase TrmB [Oscillospiraceae bacterium]MBQ3049057.1 tRNA (guanosine(46)-N7)-methyltransferase TrmB [Oscillospiraceae bacterium]